MKGQPFGHRTVSTLYARCDKLWHASHFRISPALNFCIGRAGLRLHRRRWGLRHRSKVLLDAALAEQVSAAIERCRRTRQALADRVLHVAREGALDELLVKPLLERRQVELEAGQAFRQARRRQSACPLRAAGRWRCLRLVVDDQGRIAGRCLRHSVVVYEFNSEKLFGEKMATNVV